MTDTTNSAEAAAAQPIPGIELGGLLDAAVRRAVGAKFADAAKGIAEKVVADFLTDDVRAQMTETAIAEAELALNPPIEVPKEDKPKRRFATVQAFVEGWVSEVYRRETTERNIESRRRWCPEWWRHGEAKARFEALWDAFETLRQGETVEMSVFWLVHADPHMTRLFDPDGPFKYCSPSEGHHGHLAALPVVPAPANYSSSGVDDEVTEPEHPSGLVIATVPNRRRVAIRTDFP